MLPVLVRGPALWILDFAFYPKKPQDAVRQALCFLSPTVFHV